MSENADGRSGSHDAANLRPAWLLALAAVSLQMVTNGRYGYFRDELYYLALSHHLALGYVDLAPLVAWLTFASRTVIGESLHAIRVLPALAYGAEVLLTGCIARELRGKRWAILLACLSVMLAPVIIGNGTRLSMNPIEPLFWMGAVYFLLRAINREQPQNLLWAGVLIGLGLENKHSTVFFVAALVVGLLMTPQRRLLATKWFWAAAAIAFLIALPNFLWQVAHHFPTLEDLRNVAATHKNVELPPLAFLKQQFMMLNPLHAVVWLAGFLFFLLVRNWRYRFLGFTYIWFLAGMMALHAKDYYLAPIYPMLYAAGGAFWERIAENRRWLQIALPALVLATGALIVPVVMPILPPNQIVPYLHALGIDPGRTETSMSGVLPQYFADEFGWPEMVGTVAGVYNALPAEERSKTAILGGNYGGAGAIDFFGSRYGLPKSISAHQNYYYWGPRQYTGESVILLEWNLKDAQFWCRDVEQGPRIEPYYGMGWEHYTILICHNFKVPLTEAWPKLKVWN